MALVVGDAAIGDDVLAGRVDPAGEFGEVRIDAAVDDGNLHALPCRARLIGGESLRGGCSVRALIRSEEHTSEIQSLMRISYAVFCLKKKKSPHTLQVTA